MAYKVLPFAQGDLEVSMDWYALKQPGLEADFLNSVKDAIKRIDQNPLSYEVRYNRKKLEVRFAPVDRFPFVIVYFVDNSRHLTIIIAIWHTARKPGKLKKRL